MSPGRLWFSLSLSLFISGPACFAQEPSSLNADPVPAAQMQQASAVTKDPVGVATARRALATMGNASTVLDAVCIGTLTLALQENQILSITIKSKGTQLVRTETNGPKGPVVRIVNHGKGAITNPDGSVRKLNFKNTIAERAAHIPALSILSEAFGPLVKVEGQIPVEQSGAANDVIAVGYTPDAAHSQTPLFLNLTRTLFFVDHATNLVSKVQFTRFSETGRAKHQIERQFGDYRSIGPLLVPFHQVTYVDGKLDTVLDLSSVQLNVGLPDTEFVVPE